MGGSENQMVEVPPRFTIDIEKVSPKVYNYRNILHVRRVLTVSLESFNPFY